MQTTLKVEAWTLLLAVEGFFLQLVARLEQMEDRIPWGWERAGPHVLAILYDALQSSANVVDSMKNVAKENSDHLRAAAGNKAWKAHWARRVAEMVADFRKKWEQGHISDNISKLFLKEWETPMPKYRGVCFPDIYLNEDWRAAAKSPNNDCYLFLDYPYFYENQLREDSSLDI